MANTPRRLTEGEYLSLLRSYEADAIQVNGDLNVENEELLRRYKGELYGDEQPERSKIVSNDVADVVEADMPSLARNFLGAAKIVIFEPNGQEQEDIDEAREKTEYIDWIVRGQRDSFRINHSFLKDILIEKVGALKYMIEERIEKRTITKQDISFEELTQVQDDLDGEDVQNIEIVERSEIRQGQDQETVDVTFEVTRIVREVNLMGIPLENLLVSPNAVNEDEATLVGDRTRKTRGELLQDGFTVEQVSKLPRRGNTEERTNLREIRFDDEGGIREEDFGDWANEEVEISDLYVRIDKDGDGVAERRHIVKSGDIILEDEPFEIVPYAITSAILMPHTLVGRSRAEITAPTARVKTSLVRGILDNSYAHNAPQLGVNDSVNYDDLLVKRPNGIVRVDGENNPGQSIFPINVDYIGDRALQVVQYMDQSRAQTTGTLLANQGLQADQFEKETATRFEGVKDAAQAKIELVARVIAETAYRRAYEGIAWLVSEYQTTETEIMVLGKPLTVDPTQWKFQHSARSTIGLGAGDGERSGETLSAIYNLQQQLKAQGSPLVDEVKVYNTLENMLKSVDIHNVGEFFNNPERPEELVVAQNEILTATVQQLQQLLQQLQNPLAEVEQIKAQARLIEAQSKASIDAAKITEDARQFDVSTAQDQLQHDQDLAFDLTKLEADTGQDIPGSSI